MFFRFFLLSLSVVQFQAPSAIFVHLSDPSILTWSWFLHYLPMNSIMTEHLPINWSPQLIFCWFCRNLQIKLHRCTCCYFKLALLFRVQPLLCFPLIARCSPSLERGKNKLPICYRKEYNILSSTQMFDGLHPFDIKKWGRAFEELKSEHHICLCIHMSLHPFI